MNHLENRVSETRTSAKRPVLFCTLIIVVCIGAVASMTNIGYQASSQTTLLNLQNLVEKDNKDSDNEKQQHSPSLYPFSNGTSLPRFIERNLFRNSFTRNNSSARRRKLKNDNHNNFPSHQSKYLFNWEATACLDASSIPRNYSSLAKNRLGGPMPGLASVNISQDTYCVWAEKGIWQPAFAPETFEILSSTHVSADEIFADYETIVTNAVEINNNNTKKSKKGRTKIHNAETLKKHKNDFGTSSAGQAEIEHLLSTVGKEFTAKNSKVDAAQLQMMMLLGLSRLKKVPMKIKIRVNGTTTITKTQNVVRINMIGLSFVRAQMSSICSIFRGFERYFDRGSHTSIRYVVTNYGDYYRIAKTAPTFVEKMKPVFDDFIEIERPDEVVFFEITYRYLATTQILLARNNHYIEYMENENKILRSKNLTTPAPPSTPTPYDIREQRYNIFYPPGDDYSGLTSIEKYGGGFSSIFSPGFILFKANKKWPSRSELPNWARFAVSKHFNLDNCDPSDCYSAIMEIAPTQAVPATRPYERLLKTSMEEYRDFLYQRNENAKNNNSVPVVPPDWFLNDPRYSPENLLRLSSDNGSNKNINARNLYFPASPPPRPRQMWIPMPNRDGGEYYREEDDLRHSQCISLHHYPQDVFLLRGGGGSPKYPLQDFVREGKLMGETEAESFERYLNTNGVCKDMLSRLYWIKYAIGAFLTQPSLAFE